MQQKIEEVLSSVMSAFRPKAKGLILDQEQQEALIKVADLYEQITGKDTFTIKKETKTTTVETATAPYKEIVELYNSICISFNPVKQITSKRKGSINARYRENGCDIEVFKTVFNKVQSSSFLRKGWDSGGKADFEWIMRPTNFTKILEGNYNRDQDNKLSSNNTSKVKTNFHNFEQRTSQYTADQLEKMVLKRR